MDLISGIAGLVLGVIVGWGIRYLVEKQKNTIAVGIPEQVALLVMQKERDAEIRTLEKEKRSVECQKATLDKESAQMQMKLSSKKEEYARLSALKEDTSALLSDHEIHLHMQIEKIHKKIAKAEDILANLNVHGADYEIRKVNLEKELLSMQEKHSALEEELRNIPQMDPTARAELQLRRSKEVAEMQKKLTSKLCRIEDSLMVLEKERGHAEMRREELACRIHCMQERYAALATGLQTGGGAAI